MKSTTKPDPAPFCRSPEISRTNCFLRSLKTRANISRPCIHLCLVRERGGRVHAVNSMEHPLLKMHPPPVAFYMKYGCIKGNMPDF